MKIKKWLVNFIRKHNPIDSQVIKIPISGHLAGDTLLRIVQVSDVHVPRSAYSVGEIAQAVKAQKPDIIFLTGDMMDGHSAFDGPKLSFLTKNLLEIAPVFAINGNHERKNRKYFAIWKSMLTLRGVHYLDDEVMDLTMNGVRFLIAGKSDLKQEDQSETDFDFLHHAEHKEAVCVLLLHHKPVTWRQFYPSLKIPTVVFSGHAHGGQIGIPFIKRGLIAPDQGFFPKYVSGLYQHSEKEFEVVSRGLVSLTRPIRINNRPHLPVIDIVGQGHETRKLQ